MIPTTTRDVHRFIPAGTQDEERAPVYLIGVPTLAGRIKLRSMLVAEGLRWWRPDKFYDAARAWLIEVQPENQQELIDLIARIEEMADTPALDAGHELGPDEIFSPTEKAELEKRVADAMEWAKLLEVLSQQSPDIARLAADNLQYMAMSPYIAASLFLRGWENVAVAFKRDPDRTVSFDLLGQLPPEDVRAIGIKITELLEPSGAQRKNSASPSSSSSTPTPSEGAPKPQTAAPGTSSEKSTEQTPA